MVSGSSQLWSRLGIAASTASIYALGWTPLDDGKIGARGLLARQVMEALVFKRVLDGAQAVGPLGVAEAGVVLEAGRMGEKQGRHWATLFIKHKHG